MTGNFDINNIRLDAGSHAKPHDGMCFMEAVSFIAREEFSDRPKCTDPVLASFLRSWNDSLSDEDRQKLKPYIARVIGTANDGGSRRRLWLCIDWVVRDFTPAWLDLAALFAQATALRDLPEIIDDAGIQPAQPAIASAAQAASAASIAARAAASNAARAAAWDAARAAASNAARAAAWDALRPTVLALQASAFRLLDRMIDATGAH